MVGRKIRNNFSAIPGRKPAMTDLMNFLHMNQGDIVISKGSQIRSQKVQG